jgi:hypothetical protein
MVYPTTSKKSTRCSNIVATSRLAVFAEKI